MSRVVSAQDFQQWADKGKYQINLGFVFLNDKTAVYTEDVDLDELPAIFACKQFPDGHPIVNDWADYLRRQDEEIAPGQELNAVRKKVEEHWRAILEAAIATGELSPR